MLCSFYGISNDCNNVAKKELGKDDMVEIKKIIFAASFFDVYFILIFSDFLDIYQLHFLNRPGSSLYLQVNICCSNWVETYLS